MNINRRSFLSSVLGSAVGLVVSTSVIPSLGRLFSNFQMTTKGGSLAVLIKSFKPGDLIALGGRPGMGKTALAQKIAQQVSIDSNGVTAWFSLEQTKEEMGMRLLASTSKIEFKKLKSGKLSSLEWTALGSAADRLSLSKILIDDRSALTVAQIRAAAINAKNESGRLDLVVVDYCQLLGKVVPFADENRFHSKLRPTTCPVRELKELALELNTPILLLSQLTRSIEHRANKRPRLDDLRWGPDLVSYADKMLFLYRDSYYDKGVKLPRRTEIILAKNRGGAIGTTVVEWDAGTANFEDMEIT